MARDPLGSCGDRNCSRARTGVGISPAPAATTAWSAPPLRRRACSNTSILFELEEPSRRLNGAAVFYTVLGTDKARGGASARAGRRVLLFHAKQQPFAAFGLELSLSRDRSFQSRRARFTGVPDSEPAPWYRLGTGCTVLLSRSSTALDT